MPTTNRAAGRRWRHFIEDQTTGQKIFQDPMTAAKAAAKALSVATGHVMVVVAVDQRDGGKEHTQGAYYGRTWRGGAHTRTRSNRSSGAFREAPAQAYASTGYGPRNAPFAVTKEGSGYVVRMNANNIMVRRRAEQDGWRGPMVLVNQRTKDGPNVFLFVPDGEDVKPHKFRTKDEAKSIVHRIARYKFLLGDFIDSYTFVG